MSTLVYTYDTFDYSFSHWRWTQYRLTRGRLVLDERDRLIRLLGLDRPDTNRQTLVHRWLNRLAPQPDLIVVREAATEVTPGTPTILTAYGGFAITNTPGYSASTVAFCEAGGVWAVAGIRGGGEYGEDWQGYWQKTDASKRQGASWVNGR